MVLSEDTLRLNQQGVLWSRTECRFRLETAEYDRVGTDLALRLELVPSRRDFYKFCLAFVGVLALLGLGWSVRRLRIAPREERPGMLWEHVQVAVFLLLSGVSFLMFFPALPVSNCGTGDVRMIDSFAAGLDRPEVFENDPILSDHRHFDWYTPLHVSIVRAFGWAGTHYSTSQAGFSFVIALAGLFGYRRLFATITGSTTFGFVCALTLWFLHQTLPLAETWGNDVVVPRTVFGALLPWAVLLALRVFPSPRHWWLATAASGLLFYVHPVSAPFLTGAIVAGFFLASGEPWRHRSVHAAVAVLAVLVVMLPYAAQYVGKYRQTVVGDTQLMEKSIQYARERFAPGFLDYQAFLANLYHLVAEHPHYWPGLAAVVVLLAFFRRDNDVRLFFGMLAGFAAVVFFIPWVDLTVANRLNRLPFQYDLMRGIRYLDVVCLAAIAVVVRHRQHFQVAWLPGAAVAAAIILVMYRGHFAATTARVRQVCAENLATLRSGPGPVAASEMEVIDALQSLRRKDERTLGPHYLRQSGIPLAVTVKDLAVFAYANPRDLVQAREALDQSAPLLKAPITIPRAAQAAAILNADIVVLNRAEVAAGVPDSKAVLFQNDRHVLVRIPPSTEPGWNESNSGDRRAPRKR